MYAIAISTINGQSAGYHLKLFKDEEQAIRQAEALEQENNLITATVVPWVSRKGPELFPV
jgi:hypothetical protein